MIKPLPYAFLVLLCLAYTGCQNEVSGSVSTSEQTTPKDSLYTLSEAMLNDRDYKGLELRFKNGIIFFKKENYKDSGRYNISDNVLYARLRTGTQSFLIAPESSFEFIILTQRDQQLSFSLK